MPTDNPVVSLLQQVPGVSEIDPTTDRVNWISSAVVRCVYEGRRAVAVGSGTKMQINGLLDLADLHLESGNVVGATRVAPDEVVLILVGDDVDSEAEGALRTLAASWRGPFTITLRRLTSRGEVLPVRTGGLEDLGDHEKYRYTEWLRYLMDSGQRPPALVERVMAGVPREHFRAYPMLSKKNWWSLRLEGLEVAQVGPTTGRVDVGRDHEGRRGPERTTWLDVVPDGRLAVTDDDTSVARAVEAITLFAAAWSKELVGQDRHDEHALESRILRGIVPIRTSHGELELLRMPDGGRVSWGSQFPTRWGRTTSTSGRYVDALLRAGATPWALELNTEGGGVASYHRRAVAQAVLYRAFIGQATHLRPWFARFDLDQTACRAAVVVPEFRREHGSWRDRLQRLCVAFDVELATVPERFARAELRPV